MNILPSKKGIALYDPGNTPHIANGRQHKIYRFDEAHVIKIPQAKIFEPALPKKQVLEDLAILKKFFFENLPFTKVYDHPIFGYVILQKYIPDIQPLRVYEDLRIKDLLRVLLKQNRKMKEQTKLSLDFFGQHGLVSILEGFWRRNPRIFALRNLGISKQAPNVILIIDTNLSLLTPVRQGRQMWLQYLIDIISYNVNKVFLWICFGEKA